jgi:hypothetical protein
MTRVTGVGCALGALAAFLATADPLRAAASASVVFAIAGERAAQSAQGPGSCAVAFLDQLCASPSTGNLSAAPAPRASERLGARFVLSSGQLRGVGPKTDLFADT